MSRALKPYFGCTLAAFLFTVLFSIPVSVHAGNDILRLLVYEGYAPEKYVKKFEKEIEAKYGRKVKMKISYAENPNDFFNSVRDKSVDLVTISHHMIKDERFNYIDKQLILPFDLKNIPNHVNVIPNLKRADYHVSNDKVYGVPVAHGSYGLAYNTKSFNNAPQSWKIFWDPAFRNKYVIGAHEYIYNVNITALSLGYPRELISSYDTLNNNKFKEKLRQLAVNANSLWVGVDKPDALIGMSFATSWGDSLNALERRGEKWKMAEPVEGTLWWIDEYAMTIALHGRPFIKKVAEEWINKSLSPKFQIDYLLRELSNCPVITNINVRLTNKEKKCVQIGTQNFFIKNRILQPTHSKRDRNGLKILWQEAIKGIDIERNKD